MDGRKMKRERERKWWGNVRFIGFMGIMRTFMKMFQASSVDVVQECQTIFNFRRVSELILELTHSHSLLRLTS